ncbi:Tight junction protein [Schistosoma japonicum]|uniref:Tight junction protein n=1 Tax=Schistosoma japonicum TaxID=6182 RepID=A0A4Z2DKX4_SCHJA|nr:Tight junction protein [Schistosoma japonicum]
MMVHPVHYSVTIMRSPTYGLGLEITGIQSSGNSKTMFIVSDVIKEGPAYEKVSKNDELLSVNGISLDSLRYSEAIQILRECGEEAELRLINHKGRINYRDQLVALEKNRIMQQTNFSSLRKPQTDCLCTPNYQSGCIHSIKCRSDTALWDLSFTSGEYSSNDYPKLVEIHLKRRNAAESLGVELLSRLTVASVDESSMGAQAGLKPGDRIIRLNGINTAHLSLIDTANMLRRQETIILVARDPLIKQNNAYYNNFGTTPLVMSSSVPADLSGLQSSRLSDKNEQQQTMRPLIQSNLVLRDQIKSLYSKQANQGEHHTYQNLGRYQDMYEVYNGNIEDQCIKCFDNLVQTQGNVTNIYKKTNQRYRMQHETSGINNGKSSEEFKKSNVPFTNKGQLFNTSKSTRTRKVTLQFNQNKCDVGLILYGGNINGVYVSKVIPDSLADQAGVSEGDKLIKLNGTDLKGWTKEEVFLALMASENKMVLELLNDPLSYNKMLESKDPHESFYVRAHFNMNHYVAGSSALMSSVKYSGLSIIRGDIFHIHDTLLDDALGTWLATKIYPNTSNSGLIPNEQRAQRYLSTNQFQENQQDAFTPPPYERVVQVDKFPFPRPVVIFGPLCELARQRLVQMSSITSTKVDYLITEPLKFIIPPINSCFISSKMNNSSNNNCSVNEDSNKPSGLIRLSAINDCMKRGYHCILDIGPSAIERLILLGIPPIVILINPSSKYQLKDLLKHYWQFNKNTSALFIPSKVASRTRPTFKEVVTTLWNSVIHLRQNKSHVITDTVPLLTISSKENSFSEIEWLRNLSEVIKFHQNSSVWIGEETEIGQWKVSESNENEQEESDDDIAKSDPETPRPLNTNTINNMKEIRQSLNDGKQTMPEVNYVVKNEVSSAMYQDNICTSPSHYVPMCHSNKIIEYYYSYTCDCVNISPTNPEECNFKEINEQTEQLDILSLDIPPLSLETLRLRIESMSTKYPLAEESFGENKPDLSHVHLVNELEQTDSQTSTISPTLSLHQLIFDDIMSSDYRQNEEQRPRPSGLINSVIDPQSAVSSLPTSPRTILAEKCGEFDSKGGILEIPEQNVCLRIPEGAISEKEGMQKIFIRVYDSGNELPIDNLPHETHLSSDKPILVSPMVMCGPRGLTFHKPVELTVPRYRLDSESSDESETKRDAHLDKWNLSLLHASAISTSTSTDSDDDSLPRTSRSNEPTKWHEIPLSARSQSPVKMNRTNSQRQKHDNNQGILSVIKNSHISILIDHF